MLTAVNAYVAGLDDAKAATTAVSSAIDEGRIQPDEGAQAFRDHLVAIYMARIERGELSGE